MARKDHVPNPPKRSQGPQRRATVASAADAERRRRTIILFAGSALAVAAAVLAIVFLTGGGGGGGDERAALEDADCTLQSFPAQENAADHSDVPTLETKPNWNSSPPTSGPHYGQTAVWGSYDEEVPLVQSTHNLEHGGVVIHYGPDVPEAEVAALKDWYANLDEPNGLIISPLSTNAAQAHALRLDGARGALRLERGRARLARDLLGLRRGRVRGLHRGAPLQGAGTARPLALSPRQLTAAAPGWRNW